ncbi:MAG: hypothetical protein KDJ65_01750 [Anaerolineae bacterium]|nr:hypothetical protein [Anaerolineae bacterium]
MSLLTRDQILSAPDASTVYEDVPVPEWGGEVRVKALSGIERDAFESSVTSFAGKKVRLSMDNVRARLVATTLIDEKGQPVLKPSDVTALGEKSAVALDRVFSVARRLAGLGSNELAQMTENL